MAGGFEPQALHELIPLQYWRNESLRHPRRRGEGQELLLACSVAGGGNPTADNCPSSVRENIIAPEW